MTHEKRYYRIPVGIVAWHGYEDGESRPVELRWEVDHTPDGADWSLHADFWVRDLSRVDDFLPLLNRLSQFGLNSAASPEALVRCLEELGYVHDQESRPL